MTLPAPEQTRMTERNAPSSSSSRAKRKYLILEVASHNAPRTSNQPAAAQPEDLDARVLTTFRKSRHELIEELAYYKAERRGFRGGNPEQDWYEAEREVEELFRRTRPF
jgi:hypothetical protein